MQSKKKFKDKFPLSAAQTIKDSVEKNELKGHYIIVEV